MPDPPDAKRIALEIKMREKIYDPVLLAFATREEATVTWKVIVEIPKPAPRIRMRRTTKQESIRERKLIKENGGQMLALEGALKQLGLDILPVKLDRGFVIEALPYHIRSLCDLPCVGSIQRKL
jgi:hypothetical protein